MINGRQTADASEQPISRRPPIRSNPMFTPPPNVKVFSTAIPLMDGTWTIKPTGDVGRFKPLKTIELSSGGSSRLPPEVLTTNGQGFGFDVSSREWNSTEGAFTIGGTNEPLTMKKSDPILQELDLRIVVTDQERIVFDFKLKDDPKPPIFLFRHSRQGIAYEPDGIESRHHVRADDRRANTDETEMCKILHMGKTYRVYVLPVRTLPSGETVFAGEMRTIRMSIIDVRGVRRWREEAERKAQRAKRAR
jgi:hypothetical protein